MHVLIILALILIKDLVRVDATHTEVGMLGSGNDPEPIVCD